MAMEPANMLERVSHALVQAAAIAPERREFYTSADERYIKSWNLDSGQLLRTFDAHRGKITALVWVGSLKFVASTSLDHSLAVWSLKGECVARAKFPCAIYSASFSTKHNSFIVGGVKKMYILKLVQNRDDWDFLVDKEFSEHTDFISEIVCTPLGRIFSCGYDGFICAFEPNVSEQIVVMSVGHGEHEVRAKARCHQGAITCATFNPENGTLITGGYDMVVNIWNADSLTAHAQYIPLSTLDLNKTILSLAFVQATRMIWVSTAGSHKPQLMDPRTGTNLTDFQPQVDLKEPFPGEHPTIMVATSGNEAISVSDHKRLTIWRYNSVACVASIHGHTDWVEFLLPHPISSQWGFVSGGADSTVRCWHSPSALYPELYSLKDLYQGHQGSVVAAVMNPDASILFTGGDDMIIRGWLLEDSGPSADAASSSTAFGMPGGSTHTRNGVDEEATSERQSKSAVGIEGQSSESAFAIAGKTSAQTARSVDEAPGGGVTFLTDAVGDDDKQAGDSAATTRAPAAQSAHGSVAVGNVRTIGMGLEAMYVRQGVPPEKNKLPGNRKVEITRAPSDPHAAAQRKPTAAAAANSNAADLGESCVMTFAGHEGRVTGLCMLDHYLISVSADHSVRVWDSNTGTLWKTIQDAHESEINDVAACQGNDTFCTVSADSLGYVWQLESAELCGVCRGSSAGVSKVVWVETHTAWVTASDDGSLRMYNPDGQTRVRANQDLSYDPDAALHRLEKTTSASTSIDVDDDSDVGETFDPGMVPVMMKIDTDGFSALAVQQNGGYIIAGLSDSSVALLDLPREVILCVYKGHEDLVRGAICLVDKGLLVTAGWDHSIRVWLLQGTRGGRRGAKAGSNTMQVDDIQTLSQAPAQPYAVRNPPYEPISLKGDKGLSKLKKKYAADADNEAPPEMTPFQKKEKAKQQSHMNWVLKMIEDGQEAHLPTRNVAATKHAASSKRR